MGWDVSVTQTEITRIWQTEQDRGEDGMEHGHVGQTRNEHDDITPTCHAMPRAVSVARTHAFVY